MQDIFFTLLSELDTAIQAIEHSSDDVTDEKIISLLADSAETIRNLLQSGIEGPTTEETPNLLPVIKQAQEDLKQYALDNDVGSLALMELNQQLQYVETTIRTVLLANAELRRKYARTVGADEIKHLQAEVSRVTDLALQRERRIAELSGDDEKVQSLTQIIAYLSGRRMPVSD